jgi:hypothetical protein
MAWTNKAKCRHLKKVTCKGTLRQVFSGHNSTVSVEQVLRHFGKIRRCLTLVLYLQVQEWISHNSSHLLAINKCIFAQSIFSSLLPLQSQPAVGFCFLQVLLRACYVVSIYPVLVT